MRTFTVALISIMSAGVVAAQTPAPTQQDSARRTVTKVDSGSPSRVEVPFKFMPDVKLDVVPPPGDGAWVLQVLTRGGLSGVGRGDFVMTSAGQLTCGRSIDFSCGNALTPQGMREFTSLIERIDATKWSLPAASLCSDCIATLVVLHKREHDIVRMNTTHWDDSQKVAPELRQVATLLARLGGKL